MILVDTSVWIEFFRRTDGPADRALTQLLEAGAPLATSEVVIMEVLAGARSDTERALLRSRVLALPLLRLRGLVDYEEAALIYRTCRSAGETIRSLTDCLIAVPAIQAGAAILHSDADFDAIARHTELEIEPLPPQQP